MEIIILIFIYLLITLVIFRAFLRIFRDNMDDLPDYIYELPPGMLIGIVAVISLMWPLHIFLLLLHIDSGGSRED